MENEIVLASRRIRVTRKIKNTYTRFTRYNSKVFTDVCKRDDTNALCRSNSAPTCVE